MFKESKAPKSGRNQLFVLELWSQDLRRYQKNATADCYDTHTTAATAFHFVKEVNAAK